MTGTSLRPISTLTTLITKERDAPGATKLIGTGKVTVTYKPTRIARHYRDGVFPPPHVEFKRELKKDMFKT